MTKIYKELLKAGFIIVRKRDSEDFSITNREDCYFSKNNKIGYFYVGFGEKRICYEYRASKECGKGASFWKGELNNRRHIVSLATSCLSWNPSKITGGRHKDYKSLKEFINTLYRKERYEVLEGDEIKSIDEYLNQASS